jgi:hypothetical protein
MCYKTGHITCFLHVVRFSLTYKTAFLILTLTKKVLIIIIFEKTLTILCPCLREVNYTGKGNYCMIRRTSNEI